MFKKISARDFVISNCEADYLRLFNELEENNIAKIVHLGTISDSDRQIDNIEKLNISQMSGPYSLYYLIKSLEQYNTPNNKIDIVLLANNSFSVTGKEEIIRPENATLLAMAKVIRKENQDYQTRSIDFDDNTAVAVITNEINHGDDIFISYRHDKKYIEVFDRVNTNDYQHNGIELEENGLYIITGGMGGIGLEISNQWRQIKILD